MTLRIDTERDPSLLYNPTAELTVLGEAINAGGERIHQLSEDMFATADGQLLWKAVDALSASGAPVCMTTVSAAVDPVLVGRALELVASCGFAYALAQLKEARALRAAHVALESGLDRVFALGRQAQRLPASNDISAFLGSLTGHVSAAAAGLNEGARITTKELVRKMMDEMERADRGEQSGAIPTGLPRLDSMLNGGLQPGEMVVIAARTGVGKSALALEICRHALKAGRSVLYGNRELTPEAILDRVISAEAGFPFRASNGAQSIPESKRKALTLAAVAFKSWNLNVRSDLRTLPGILGEARTTRPDLVVIDHISAFGDSTGRKGASLFEIVTHNSNAARDMALDLRIPVLVLSQLNRAAAESEEPGLHHLKQSGSLEEDARVVMILHRAEVVSTSLQRMDLAVAKQSHGPTGLLPLNFNPECQRFEEVGPEIRAEDCNP